MGETKVNALQTICDEATERVQACDELTEEKVWSRHETSIWQAKRFVGTPHFYPVYRYQNLYSYSPLSLILIKKTLRLNRRVTRRIAKADFLRDSHFPYPHYTGNGTVDRDISRVGGPPRAGFLIKDADEYARRLAQALRQDTSAVEDTHPGFTNIILCGGKDSLNLSLIPWKNPVILASAPPNYDLVKKFVTDNDMKHDVIRLQDDDKSLLNVEILVNCCRNSLIHCRWGPHLKKLSSELGGRVIFWKGQNGTPIMTPRWKKWMYAPHGVSPYVSQVAKLFGGRRANRLHRMLEMCTYTQRYSFKLLWHKGAMAQGSHMSIIRQLTNALVLSGYHGPAVRRAVYEVDMHRAVQQDLRPRIGWYLHGNPVLYPSRNPSPSPSEIRNGISDVGTFLRILSSCGITIHDE